MASWFSVIDKFRKKYGNSRIEHTHIYKNGTLVGTYSGSKRSSSFGNSIKDTDTIHNHPTGTPAYSESDVIMSIYGDVHSMTTVSLTRGAWILIRPTHGWPNVTHNQIESEYKRSLQNEKSLDSTKQLISDIRSKRISMNDGENIFSERYAYNALKNLGLDVSIDK